MLEHLRLFAATTLAATIATSGVAMSAAPASASLGPVKKCSAKKNLAPHVPGQVCVEVDHSSDGREVVVTSRLYADNLTDKTRKLTGRVVTKIPHQTTVGRTATRTFKPYAGADVTSTLTGYLVRHGTAYITGWAGPDKTHFRLTVKF
jgi:hypothetical protein